MNNSHYQFEYADVSVYACAVSLITKYAAPSCIHVDLGCGYAAIAKKLTELGIRYIGFDANENTVTALRTNGVEAYLIDLLSPDEAIDTILKVCGEITISTVSMLDVIEHLDIECHFLETLRLRLPNIDQVTLIISVPNFSHTDVAIKLLAGDWEYTQSGLLDNTHRVIYTENHLEQTLLRRGWHEIDKFDYHQEYSDQYFLQPRIVLNRHGGIGEHLYAIKKMLDKNASVHQFVRAYKTTQINKIVPENLKKSILLSVIVLDSAALAAVNDALAALTHADYIEQIDIVCSEQLTTGIDSLRGRYWTVCSVDALLTRDYFNEVLPLLLQETELSVLYMSSVITSHMPNVYWNVNDIVELLNLPCISFLLPGDYARQFRAYLPDLNGSLAWQQYCVTAALCIGVKQLTMQHEVFSEVRMPSQHYAMLSTDQLMTNDTVRLVNSTSIIQIQQQKIIEQQQSIHEIQEHLRAITMSLSWRLTLPLRQAKRIISLGRKWSRLNWLAYDTWRLLFRALVARMPMLRVLRQKYLHWKFVLLASSKLLGYSSDNLPALQSLSSRRFDQRDLMMVNAKSASHHFPVIDISVVTYNSSQWVHLFVESLMAQAYPLEKINLYVVDNGSQDDTVRQFKVALAEHSSAFASVKLIQQENVGFGAGHDKAIRAGNAAYCLVTNIDLAFLSDSLVQLVSAAVSDTAAEVASWECRQIPFEHPKYYDPVTLETNWSSHACVLLRRSAYEQVGGYDPAIFMYAEDVELSYRFRSHGYALKYVPRATVKHFTYASAGEIKPLQFAGSAIGNLYIRLRYGKMIDRVMGILLYGALLVKPAPFAGARSLLLKQSRTLLAKLPHFLGGKGNIPAYFPLLGFDYEMIREGAFWEISPPPSADVAPLVSIITRTYRGRTTFLTQAIQSVFNQTYPNIELLVVEDGGNTQQALVDALSVKAPLGCRVRFIPCEKLGRSGAGNQALAATAGRFVMFLDDDDLLFADHVETLMAVLTQDDGLAAAYALALEVLTDTHEKEGRYRETSFYTPEIFKQQWDYNVLIDHNFIPIQAILFKRELYELRGGFDVTLDQLEDWNLWMRYGYGNRFAYVPKTTSLFRSPADFTLRSKRHAALHEAYDAAKRKALQRLNVPFVNR